MKFGAALPFEPDTWSRAGRIEQLGYDSLWTGDHVLGEVPTCDALIMLAYYARQTTSVSLGSGVLALPLRHPVPLAKAVATLDLVSAGRVILGVGVGGESPSEFEACGVPLEERGSRADEAIEIMRQLWTGLPSTHSGKHFTFRDVKIAPPPGQSGGPPVWIAGRSSAAVRRAARKGDGYLPYLVDPDQYRTRLGKLREETERAGRDPESVVPGLWQAICPTDSYATSRAQACETLGTAYGSSMDRTVDRHVALGTIEDCCRRIEDYIDAGARHIVVGPVGRSEIRFRQLELFAQEAAHRLRASGGGALP